MSVDKGNGRGRLKIIRTGGNIDVVNELAHGQEYWVPGYHDPSQEIEFKTGISRKSIRRILKHDLNCDTFLSNCSLTFLYPPPYLLLLHVLLFKRSEIFTHGEGCIP